MTNRTQTPTTAGRAMTCVCGKPATVRLHVNYTYPRRQREPDAWDPCHVLGTAGSIQTCGRPRCTRAALTWHRKQLIDELAQRSWLNADQLAAVEVFADDSPVRPGPAS
jgi:hypothetical protein